MIKERIEEDFPEEERNDATMYLALIMSALCSPLWLNQATNNAFTIIENPMPLEDMKLPKCLRIAADILEVLISDLNKRKEEIALKEQAKEVLNKIREEFK